MTRLFVWGGLITVGVLLIALAVPLFGGEGPLDPPNGHPWEGNNNTPAEPSRVSIIIIKGNWFPTSTLLIWRTNISQVRMVPSTTVEPSSQQPIPLKTDVGQQPSSFRTK